jgi:hypothetical protein
MDRNRELLDAFAEARRTWDDLVMLQPDVRAANGGLTAADVSELGRVSAHRETIDFLAESLDTREE